MIDKVLLPGNVLYCADFRGDYLRDGRLAPHPPMDIPLPHGVEVEKAAKYLNMRPEDLIKIMQPYQQQLGEARRMQYEQHRYPYQAARGNPPAPPSAGDPRRARAYTPQSFISAAAQQVALNPYAGAGQGHVALTPAQRHTMTMYQRGVPLGLSSELPTWDPLPRASDGPRWGEIVGHRAWLLNKSRDRLFSMVVMQVGWPPGGVVTDRCAEKWQGQGGVDDHNNRGVWAFKNAYGVGTEFGNTFLQGTRNCVFGTVWMWGTVIEHQRGYRSQYAAVRSLDLATKGVDLDALRAIYCPNPTKGD